MLQLREQQDHVATLRHMLAELLEKQSSATLTDEQRKLHRMGIQALEAAVDAIMVQVYA